MEPDNEPGNEKVFAALVQLLEQLPDWQVRRVMEAVGFPSTSSPSNTLDQLKVAWEAVQEEDPEKAREKLLMITSQLITDVERTRVDEALGAWGVWLVGDEFQPVQRTEGMITGRGEQTLPSLTQSGGDRELPRGDQTLPSLTSSSEATVTPPERRAQTVGAGLAAVSVDRIRLSSPDAVLNSKAREKHRISHARLVELSETLDQFHGSDYPDATGSPNTQEVPLSEDDLKLLRAVVKSAIELHASSTFPSQIKEALKKLYEFLVEMKERLDKLSGTVDSLKLLAFKVGEAALAIKELLDILGVTYAMN